jgi:DNA repair ATPase RecN
MADKLEQVVGISAVKEQLEEFVEYKKTLETALKEMSKTIENLAERTTNNDSIMENMEAIKQDLKQTQSKIPDKEQLDQIVQTMGEAITKRIDNIADDVGNMGTKVNEMAEKTEEVFEKAEKSLEFRNKIKELFKFITSD